MCILRIRPSDGAWCTHDYVDPLLTTSLANFKNPKHDLVHVAWNPVGYELLIVDACGRIALCLTYNANNRIFVSRTLIFEPEDSLGTLVGLKHMYPKRQVSQLHQSKSHWFSYT